MVDLKPCGKGDEWHNMWSLDRIMTILSVFVMLIAGGSFILTWDGKIDLTTKTIESIENDLGEVSKDVAVIRAVQDRIKEDVKELKDEQKQERYQ